MEDFGSYTCADCGKRFERGRSEQDADIEAAANFGPGWEMNEVCDNCYSRFMEWLKQNAAKQ